VTLEELYDYIYSRVVKQTPKQTPRKWSYNQEGEFIIARNPKPPAPKVTPLPLELQQSIDDPRTWVREGAVAELSRLLSGGQPGLSAAAHTALLRLTADDSRRVAEAASKTLAAWTGEAAHQHPPAERTKDSAQRAAEAEAEAMAQRAAQAEETARREASQRAAEEAARLEREQAAYAVAAQRMGKTVALTPPTDEDAATTSQAPSPQPAGWMDKPWFPLAALTVGWALAFFSGTGIFWTLYANNALDTSRFGELLVVGLIGGTATWLGLRASLPRDPPVPAPLIIGLGVVIALSGTVIYPALESSGFGPDESVALERAILGTLSGLGIGALLYQRRTLEAERALLIIAGWAIGWSVAAWLGLTVYNFFGDDPSSGIKEALQPVMADDLAHALVPWVDALIRGLIGALAGFISGWVMLGQLRQPDTT
jgi:hypothetical protein